MKFGTFGLMFYKIKLLLSRYMRLKYGIPNRVVGTCFCGRSLGGE